MSIKINEPTVKKNRLSFDKKKLSINPISEYEPRPIHLNTTFGSKTYSKKCNTVKSALDKFNDHFAKAPKFEIKKEEVFNKRHSSHQKFLR